MLNARTRLAATAAGTAVAMFAALPQAAAQAVELTAVAGLAESNPLTMNFRENFEKVLNEKGAGVITVRYVGGPEVVPPNRAHSAVQRGQFDLLNSPISYYVGSFPEAYAMLASNVPIQELRKNGGFELLNKIHQEKVPGLKILAWADAPQAYYTYLSIEPKLDEHGVPDLRGVRMRATGTYRPLFQALGASTVNMAGNEIYTGMERGVVQGFGWPVSGAAGLGLHRLVKVRILPEYYATNHATVMNVDKWNSLTQKQKEILMEVALHQEKVGPAFMAEHAEKETKTFREAGVKDLVLEGKAAERYLGIAYDVIWQELEKRAPESVEKLRPLLYRAPGS